MIGMRTGSGKRLLAWNTRGHSPVVRCVVAALLCGFFLAAGAEEWGVLLGPDAAAHAGFQAAVEDLNAAGGPLGIHFAPMTALSADVANLILVGDAARNPAAASFFPEGAETPAHPQGYRLLTRARGEGRLLTVAGGSWQGDLYGLYWVWDRLRVHQRIRDLNGVRVPALPVRLTEGTSREHIRAALRHAATWVSGGSIPDLAPWGVPGLDEQNAEHRRELAELVDLAHGYGLKYLAIGDAIAYHPDFFAAAGATEDPANPRLWEAVAETYRRLFQAMPALDGVRVRTGELTRIVDPYIAYNVMHDPPDHPWTLDRRYRTFVRTVHAVVVGEFDKIYFHRTWVTNTTEQHSDPAVYRAIFTDAVPTRGLYLSPYMSLGDRWYYQPYNPTFNQTPHAMVALLSTLDYHAAPGVPVFPSFPGAYHQGGLRQVLAHENSNLRGVHFAAPARDAWDTATVTAYLAARLAWDPDEPLETIAEDFAAIHAGRDVAPILAEILLLSQTAYKDGIYVKPVAESISGNTLPHLRLTTFPVQGLPEVDRGRAHIEWLRATMYTPCTGREAEAVAHLERGLDAAREMSALYERAAPGIADAELRGAIADSLSLTEALVETNCAYVKACLAFFPWFDGPSPGRRDALEEAIAALKTARDRFMDAPGFCYKLHGINQLVLNAEVALADLEQSKAALRRAPRDGEIAQLITAQQAAHVTALEAHRDSAVRLLHWRGKVDGRDVVRMRGGHVTVEHLQGDEVVGVQFEVSAPLPAAPVTVLVEDNGSRPIRPFVLRQPAEENGFEVAVYLFDEPPSSGWFDFTLYCVPESAEAPDLPPPWE